MSKKSFFLFTLFCFFRLISVSQNKPNNPYKSAELLDVDRKILSDQSFANPAIADSVVLGLILDKLDSIKNKDIYNLLTTYKKSLEDHAIIFIKHPRPIIDDKGIKKEDKQIDQLQSVILHTEIGAYSQYLLETKKILVVMIDDMGTLDEATVKVEKQKGRFQTTFKDMLDLITNVTKAVPGKVKINLRVIELDESEIPAPCKITIVYAKAPKDFAITIHEKNHWSFQAGVNASQIDKNAFSISGTTLTISPNADEQKAWKANLIGMIVWHPWGQDFDRMASIFTRTKEHTWAYDYVQQRIGFFAGLKIDKDPLQTISGGVNLALFKDIYINIGCSFISEIDQNKKYDVGNISSIAGLEDYFTRSYKPKFLIGFSVSPGKMLTYLKSK